MQFLLFNLSIIVCSVSLGFSFLLDGQPENSPNVTHEVHKLQIEVSMLKDMVTTLQESCPSCAVQKKRPIPAFMSTLTSADLTCPEDAPLIFDRELLDTSNSYDVRHGIFRAPTNGTFVFTATLTAKTGKRINAKIVKNFPTNEIGLLFSNYAQYGWNQCSTTIVVQLGAGDDVWLVCTHSSEITGGNTGGHDDFNSHFSGFLIDAH